MGPKYENWFDQLDERINQLPTPEQGKGEREGGVSPETTPLQCPECGAIDCPHFLLVRQCRASTEPLKNVS